MRKTYLLLTAVLITVVVLSIGCTRVDLREEGNTTSATLRAQGAEKVAAEIHMGPGNLTITGGVGVLMDAEYRYSDNRIAPESDYRVDGDVGELDIRQGETGHWFPGFWGPGYVNDWTLAFTDDVPLDLRLQLAAGDVDVEMGDTMLEDFRLEVGAGSFDIDLSDSDSLEDFRVTTGAGDVRIDASGGSALRRFQLEAGAGSLRLDLSGSDWSEDIEGRIDAGVGDLTITLPKDIGVEVEVDSGVGDVSVDGLLHDGDTWVNEAHGEIGPVVSIRISQGIGSVHLDIE